MKRSAWALVLLATFAVSGCGAVRGCGVVRDFRKSRHLKAAEGYHAGKKYKEATIEYRNALRFDPQDLQTVKKLAFAYYENGQVGEAFPPLKRYVDGNPDDLEARQKLGTIYLMGRAPDKAREQAETILAKQPDDLDALLLVAEAAETPEQIRDAIARLEAKRATLGDPDRVARALGMLYARSKDMPRAEREFRAAVSSKPDSPDAHLALARLHLVKGELAEAEKEFKAAAELGPPGSFAGLQLADFYVLTRRVEDAKTFLTDVTTKAPDAFPAWLRLGEIAFAEGQFDEAQRFISRVLDTNPDDVSALVIQARLQLARREASKAVETATRATRAQPSNGLAFHTLAIAQVAAGNPALAFSAAKDAVARSPMLADAVLLVAELDLRSGNTVGAISGLQAYLEKQPRDPRAWEALGRTQLRARNPVAAYTSFSRAAELTPASARGPFLLGLALRSQGRAVEARQQFERSLAMGPAFPEPLEQLAGMSFAEKNPAAGIARVERQALLEPRSPEIQYLLGRVCQLAGETQRAEQAYRKAVDLNPNAIGPYVALGQLYGKSQDYPRAIAELDKALAANPEQPAALMLWSIAQHMGGDQGKAREGYEKLTKTNPRFAPAANNLAWMLAEEGKDLPRAFLLAQSARDAAPQDPQVADTLGWVLYKQSAYPGAAALFQEAAEKLPTNAEVMYHLGLAQAKLGKNAEARAALQKSLELSATHPGAAEAKALLASLPAGQ